MAQTQGITIFRGFRTEYSDGREIPYFRELANSGRIFSINELQTELAVQGLRIGDSRPKIVSGDHETYIDYYLLNAEGIPIYELGLSFQKLEREKI